MVFWMMFFILAFSLLLKYCFGNLMCNFLRELFRLVVKFGMFLFVLVEFLGLNLVMEFNSNVVFFVVCVMGLVWFREEVKVIIF